jgi:hypothetical protein
MPTEHILALLIQERDKLNRAIELLQGTKRRGRPPKNLGAGMFHTPHSSQAVKPKKKARTFTPAQRKAQAARMRAYWAAKRAAK